MLKLKASREKKNTWWLRRRRVSARYLNWVGTCSRCDVTLGRFCRSQPKMTPHTKKRLLPNTVKLSAIAASE